MTITGKDAEALAQVLVDREIRRPLKPGREPPDTPHPRQDKGSDLLAREIVAEEVPLVRNTGQVIGPHPARLVGLALRLLVLELNLARLDHPLAHRLEEIDVRRRAAKPAKGNRRVDIAPLEI